MIQNAVLRSGDSSSKAKDHIGKMGGSDTFTLKEENLPPHHHYMKYDNYSITSEQILGALKFPERTGEEPASSSITTSGDISWVSVPLWAANTALQVKAGKMFAYSDQDSPALANKFVSVGESIGTAELPPDTKNYKVLVTQVETGGNSGNKETFTFNGTVNLNHSHPFGTVTFVKEKSKSGEDLDTPKTITVKPSDGHSYGIIDDTKQLEGAATLVRGKEVNNIPHHRLTYIFWRVGKNEEVKEPVYYDRQPTVEGGTN